MTDPAHGLIKPDAVAPTLAEFRVQVAEAALRTLKKALTDTGRRTFKLEIEQATTVADVLEVADRWITTVKFFSRPDANDRLERSSLAREQQVQGETPQQLFARLGI